MKKNLDGETRRCWGRFATYMSIPTLSLLVALLLPESKLGGVGLGLSPSAAAGAIDDPKVLRSLLGFRENPTLHKHPARLAPVDRPGMIVHLSLPEKSAQDMRDSRGFGVDNPTKWRWQDMAISIEGGPEFAGLMRVRGRGSAGDDKKSFSIRLLTSQAFLPELKIRRFFLINMLFDPHFFETRLAYILAESLGIFPAYNQFADVYINGRHEGLYLLVERPEEALLRSDEGIKAIVRKGWGDNVYEPKYLAPGNQFLAMTRQLEEAHQISDPGEQAERYSTYLDLGAFLTWMSFNSLMQNADSRDEIYLYEQSGPEGRSVMSVMGWDYDDLQAPALVPGYNHPDPLSWAAQTQFEKDILDNPFLRGQYESVLRSVLGRLTPHEVDEELSRVVAVLERIRAERPRGVVVRSSRERYDVTELRAAAAEFMETFAERHAELTLNLDRRSSERAEGAGN